MDFTLHSHQHTVNVRRRFHRTFFSWLQDNQSRFVTPPFHLINRTDCFMTFNIEDLNPAISFGLSRWELGVHVHWQGVYWDSLIYFESLPKAVAGAYKCNFCELESHKTYHSREELWIDHDFEPFLDWVNTELTQKHWLALSGTADNSTWANLVKEPDPTSSFNVPVWIGNDEHTRNLS
jgi:hypothetical protein